MNATPTKPGNLADILRADDYLRQRLEPRRRDLEYLLHLDLRDAVLDLCRPLKGRLLDYGCGGSPYRAILPQFSPYVRADIAAGEAIDLTLDASGGLPSQPGSSYDVVFSTQVLEHVADAERYLREAFRLLRPGGALVITTHGFVPEHGCPYDFHRWTGYGLEHEVEKAGFIVEESWKLTVGLRALIYFFHFSVLYPSTWPPKPVLRFLLMIFRGFYRRIGVALLNWFGDTMPTQARAAGHSEPDQLYIGVALRAHKPETR